MLGQRTDIKFFYHTSILFDCYPFVNKSWQIHVKGYPCRAEIN